MYKRPHLECVCPGSGCASGAMQACASHVVGWICHPVRIPEDGAADRSRAGHATVRTVSKRWASEIPRLFHVPAHQWEDQLRQRAPLGQFGSGENHQTDPATAFSSNVAGERYRSIYAFMGDKEQPTLVKAAKGSAGMKVSARYRQLAARQPGKRWHALNASRVADQPLAFPTQAQALCRERDGECMHGIRVLFPAFDREVFGVSARDRGCGTNRDHTKICDGGRSDAGAHRVA